MSELKVIESCLKKYLCSHDLGFFVEDSEISFIKSGSTSPFMNFAIINKINNAKNQKEAFDTNFNVLGFVLSMPAHRPIVTSIVSGIRYIGNVFICISDGYTGEPTKNDIEIEELNKSNLNDYISFMKKERLVEPEISRYIIESCSEDLYVYLAYKDSEIVGAGSAIRDNESIYIFDTIVREDQREKGIFSAIVTRSMSDVSKTGRYNYYAIVSSPQSRAGASKANYEKNMVMDLWMKEQ